MRSLPIVLAILAAMFYIGGPPNAASQDAVVALLTSPGLLAIAAVLLGLYEWLSEPGAASTASKPPTKVSTAKTPAEEAPSSSASIQGAESPKAD